MWQLFENTKCFQEELLKANNTLHNYILQTSPHLISLSLPIGKRCMHLNFKSRLATGHLFEKTALFQKLEIQFFDCFFNLSVPTPQNSQTHSNN